MVLPASQKWPFVINLGNSIIGVAILAMPFCFKQCGILLGVLVLLCCTWLTLASCQLLVKAGIMSHYQSYEFLAYHTYGAPGKFLVEMGMIGMQLGTLVAQIVVIGDLGPPIISHLFGVENSFQNRMYLIIILCLFVGLPLGLMKDLRNVSRASTICIMFYAVFIVYSLWLSSGNALKGDWFYNVNWWRPQGFFQCLPIISFSFGCQTQLFIMYDALPEPSLQTIKGIIHSAVSLCTISYLLVGFFGYVTFYHLDIPGDVITVFPDTVATRMIKLGFVMSIAITFPVIIYPCRASLYTLLFQKKSKHSDIVSGTYIPEHLFKGITVAIVMGSMITGILIPNVEFVLGLNGAITGTLICYIFPALFFLRVSKPEGKTIAQIVLVLGIAILLVSTFTTLYAQDKSHASEDVQKAAQEAADRARGVGGPLPGPDHAEGNIDKNPVLHAPKADENANQGNSNRRLEPPNPFAPADSAKVDNDAKQNNKPTGGGGGKEPAEKDKAASQKGRKEETVKVVAREVKEGGKKKTEEGGGKESRKVQEQLRGALAAQPPQKEQPQRERQVQQQEQPPKQKSGAEANALKVDQGRGNPPSGVVQSQNAAVRPPAVAQPGQGAVNQGVVNQGVVNQGAANQGVVNQGVVNQGVVNQGVNQGAVNQGAVISKGVVNQGVAQGQAASKDLPAGGQGQGQNGGNHHKIGAPNPHIVKRSASQQGESDAHPPEKAGTQGEGKGRPAQGGAPQGAPQGSDQAHQEKAQQQDQAKPPPQQSADKLPQAQAALAAQEESLRQGQGRPAQEHDAHPDKAIAGQQPHREILAQGELHTQQPVGKQQQGQGPPQGQQQQQGH
ncbi:hypothetical protein ACOMHN_067181 [Nucella lapillus]